MFGCTAKKTIEGEKEEEKKGTLRSVVYTVAVLVQLIWMIFLLWEIGWILTKNLNVDMDHPSWGVEVVNQLQHVMKKLLLLILHIGKILPPVFSSSRNRVLVQICFTSLSMLVLTCLAVSDIYWLYNIGEEELLFHLNDFVTEGITYIVMATAFVYIILHTLDDSRKLTDQGKRYGFELLIICGTAFLSSSHPHVPDDYIQKVHRQLRPYALIAYLIIVQTRHYVEEHSGYYTASQAQEVSKEFLRRYPLNENQKLLIEDTTVGKKLVNILVEKPIYPKLC